MLWVILLEGWAGQWAHPLIGPHHEVFIFSSHFFFQFVESLHLSSARHAATWAHFAASLAFSARSRSASCCKLLESLTLFFRRFIFLWSSSWAFRSSATLQLFILVTTKQTVAKACPICFMASQTKWSSSKAMILSLSSLGKKAFSKYVGISRLGSHRFFPSELPALHSWTILHLDGLRSEQCLNEEFSYQSVSAQQGE